LKRLIFIYPYLTSYILPVFYGMAESGRVLIDVLYGPLPSGMGFDKHQHFAHPNVRWFQASEWKPFGEKIGMCQKGVLFQILKTRPDVICTWANPRYLSFWGVLLLGRLLGIPVYARGHGLFKKERVRLLEKIMYKTILLLTHKYICYTPAVKRSLEFVSKQNVKLAVDFNTLHNAHPVRPEEKNGQENGIFYIGRIRTGCGVNMLVDVLTKLNQKKNIDIKLHVIGDGPFSAFLREKSMQLHWLNYYGNCFDQKKISIISRQCRFGCVPGFMGLNVVHMMSLSLPVITHSDLHSHMGPEPEYVKHEMNGYLFEKPNDIMSITEGIMALWQKTPFEMKAMQRNAYLTYEKLSDPPQYARLLRIIEI